MAIRPRLATLIWTLAVPTGAFAQTKPADLTHTSIEDLMNIEITSVSHKEQRAGDATAAVYVVTQEDIRRSGMTTVPELLGLVPGVQVAQINSNKRSASINLVWRPVKRKPCSNVPCSSSCAA